MHPRLRELLDYAEARRGDLLAAVAEVPEPLRHRRPGADAWSVAEVLEHLLLVERGVARLLSRRIERAKAAGLERETETASLLGSLDRFGLLERRSPMPVPDLVRPPGTLSARAAAAALAESRLALLEALAQGDGLALDTVTAPHVRLGPLTLYQWVLFVGQHEARHTAQVRAIRQQLAAEPTDAPP